MPDMNSSLTLLATDTFKLVFACLLGGIIGYTREQRGISLGLRTHIIVCVAATLAQIISINYMLLKSPLSYDPMRLGAQVISGIGFLGAGAIMKDKTKSTVKGLTTASSVLFIACVGLAIGAGFYFQAFIAAFIVFLLLESPKISFFPNKSHLATLNIVCNIDSVSDDFLPIVENILVEHNITISTICNVNKHDDSVSILLNISYPDAISLNECILSLITTSSVVDVKIMP